MASASLAYEVRVTDSAERDLERIYDYLVEAESVTRADVVLDQLMHVVEQLSLFPNRGKYPDELVDMGRRQFRQVNFKPFRVIYEVRGQAVIVHVIADGRRNMRALLFRRLMDM